MRVLRAFVLLTLLSVSALAADLKIRVVDPHSAAVPGAQVSVFAVDDATPIAITTSSAEGAASIAGLNSGSYRVQVLAPGFAAKTTDVSLTQPSTITVQLSIAGVSEIVVVSATRTPLPFRCSRASGTRRG